MTLKRALAVAATFAPLLAGPLLAGSALAQSSNDPAPAGDATVNALAMRPLPQGATLVVRPLDDSDASKEIQVLFERALRDRGYPLAADGRLILTFETRDRIGTWSSGVCAQISSPGPKPTVGTPNIPHEATPLVEKFQRETRGGAPRTEPAVAIAAATAGSASSSSQLG